jgi:hypothetical protein
MKTRMAAVLLAAAFASPALAQPAPGGDFDKYREQMWTRMQQMHEQMDKIRATTDPKERDKLLRENFETMQQGMGTMRSFGPMMGGRGMMGPGGGMGPGSGMGPGAGGMGGGMMGRGFGRGAYAPSECGKLGDPASRRDCMQDERLDIMQDMMDQMVQREGMRQGPGRRR